jgi:hypothetical protein
VHWCGSHCHRTGVGGKPCRGDDGAPPSPTRSGDARRPQGEHQQVLLALLSWLVGRRDGAPPPPTPASRFGPPRRSVVQPSPSRLGRLEVAAVSGGAGGCLRVRQPFCRRPPLDMHEMPSCLIAVSSLEQCAGRISAPRRMKN